MMFSLFCRSKSIFLALCWSSCSFAAHADDDALKQTVDRIVGRAAEERSIPGVIVGISWHGKRSYFAYSGTSEARFDRDTIVEIGSITKVFTTALFAEAVQEGRMRTDEPISAYTRIPLQSCAAQVTPLQLADFSSGMPRLPRDLPRELRERGIDHYTREDFFRWVSHWDPGEGYGCDLPAPYKYSNASVGLLGYLVADRLEAPWADLVRERITGPLGMTSTRMEVPDNQRSRLARGHLRDGAPAMPWPVFAWFAAGALRSTAADMLAFGEAALGHREADGHEVPPALTTALKTAMTPIYQPEDETNLVGMSWAINPGDPDDGTYPLTLKDGGTDGFSSVIVINPRKDLAVFLAANKAGINISNLGVRLSRHIRE